MTLPDGRQVDGVRGIQDYLVESKSRQFARALVKRLLTYSLGRSLEYSDRRLVDSLTRGFIESDYRLGGLIVAIADSRLFLTK
ncbi:MAG: hypothetical protein CM1200mP2_05310 [Planctomycetaceae bacterium]|nr:MAG: hypothetical protein CM1200mP2_05310 [Planctomycetaceae bacterium]